MGAFAKKAECHQKARSWNHWRFLCSLPKSICRGTTYMWKLIYASFSCQVSLRLTAWIAESLVSPMAAVLRENIVYLLLISVASFALCWRTFFSLFTFPCVNDLWYQIIWNILHRDDPPKKECLLLGISQIRGGGGPRSQFLAFFSSSTSFYSKVIIFVCFLVNFFIITIKITILLII